MAQEEIIYINNDLRTMLIPDNFILGVQDDRFTHRIKFRLPRYYHGIDFNDGYRICVKYENALLEDDEAMIWPDDITVEETAIFFYWNPARTAYMSDGWVNFCVTLTHLDVMHGNGEESADVLNQFSTAAHRVRVLKGIELDNLIPEEIEKNIIVQAWEILTLAMARAEAARVSEENARTSELNAKQSELNSADSERTANEWRLRSEAWAVGKRNGVPVASDNECYKNNSKYWAEQSRDKTIFGNQTVYDAMNYVYPVGAIYMSTVNIDPAVIFGGTWQRLKSKFLFGCEDSGTYANGNTGGASTVTLSTDQIPSHKHTFTGNENTTTSVGLTSNGPSTNNTGGTALTTSGSRQANDTTKARTSVDAFSGYTSGPRVQNSNHDNMTTISLSGLHADSGYPKRIVDGQVVSMSEVVAAGKLNTSYGGYWDNGVWTNNKWVDSAGAYHITYGGNTGTCTANTGRPLNPTSPYARNDSTSDLGSSYKFTTSSDGNHKHSSPSYSKGLTGKNVYPLSNFEDAGHDHFVTSYSSSTYREYVGNYDSDNAGGHTHTVSINHVHTFSHVHDMYHAHAMAHQHDIPDHQHSYQHYHYVPEHTHNMNHYHDISHSHDIAHNHNFDHGHGMEHKHVIDSHTHSLSNHTHSINAHSHKVTPTGSISNTGGGQAHNNMPPYLCVYMWKRTALAPNWS